MFLHSECKTGRLSSRCTSYCKACNDQVRIAAENGVSIAVGGDVALSVQQTGTGGGACVSGKFCSGALCNGIDACPVITQQQQEIVSTDYWLHGHLQHSYPNGRLRRTELFG